MNIKFSLILIVLLLSVLLVACGPESVNGPVVDKIYRASYTTVNLEAQEIGDITVYIPKTIIHPASWYLVVYNCVEDECNNIRWLVTESIYNKYNINDRFNSEKP